MCYYPPSDVPSAPTNLRATDVYTDSIGIEWNKPTSDGGSKIIAYIIERRDPIRNFWCNVGSVDGNKTNYAVPVVPGTEYWFRVTAENDMGVSEPISMNVPVKAKTFDTALVPLESVPPVGPVRHVDVRRDSITLAWEPPAIEAPKVKSFILEKYDDRVRTWDRITALPPVVTR